MSITSSFDSLQLSDTTREAVQKMGFEEPTAIQTHTIPHMLRWCDVIAKAPTGTGKTVAFGIPIIEHIQDSDQGLQALILAPTRELAIQITDDMIQIASTRPDIRIATLYGGQPISLQITQLHKHPHIVIATPGRLLDHLHRKTMNLRQVHTVILDEADRMLDMGFVRDVRQILDLMPNVSQIAMFSATLSRSVMDISWIYQRDVIEVTVEAEQQNRPQIKQYSIEASGQHRIKIILKLLEDKGYKKALIFCNTKRSVQVVTQQLKRAGCNADCIHGDLRQSQRERVISSFRKNRIRVLVATDVASRGLDIESVDAVFNYDVPEENERYIHRIGRTGRAKKEGVAYTFTNLLNHGQLKEIARLTQSEIQILDLSADNETHV